MSINLNSKLVCVLLNSWDGQREWTINLPDNEDICGLAVTTDWVAASTSQRFLRLYSISGVQREIISIPGPIVALNGSRNHLVVVHHHGKRMHLFLHYFYFIKNNYLSLINYP